MTPKLGRVNHFIDQFMRARWLSTKPTRPSQMCWNLAAMSLPSANMGLGWNANRCGRALESRHKISVPFQVKEYPVDILASFHEHFDYVIRSTSSSHKFVSISISTSFITLDSFQDVRRWIWWRR